MTQFNRTWRTRRCSGMRRTCPSQLHLLSRAFIATFIVGFRASSWMVLPVIVASILDAAPSTWVLPQLAPAALLDAYAPSTSASEHPAVAAQRGSAQLPYSSASPPVCFPDHHAVSLPPPAPEPQRTRRLSFEPLSPKCVCSRLLTIRPVVG